MADPFQDVDAAGAAFIKSFADSMDERQSDPTMERIVAAYLDKVAFPADALTVEVGAGAGAVTRRIAARAAPSRVIGYEPSKGFVAEARARVTGLDNVSFEVADGTQLPLSDATADTVIMHTLLTHVPDPAALIAEGCRVLKPGGTLIICDADFSKGSLAAFANDPLDACAKAFVADFVTDPFVVAKLKGLVLAAGLHILSFDVTSRVVGDSTQMLPWVEEAAKNMVARGQIGEDLAKALVAEYHRRNDDGVLYGYQAFATLVAVKPDSGH